MPDGEAVYVVGRLRALAGTARYEMDDALRAELRELSAMLYEPAGLNAKRKPDQGGQQ